MSNIYIKDLLNKGWEMVSAESFTSFVDYKMRKYRLADRDARGDYNEYWYIKFTIGQPNCEPFHDKNFLYEEEPIYTISLYYTTNGSRYEQTNKLLADCMFVSSLEMIDAFEKLFRISQSSSKINK